MKSGSDGRIEPVAAVVQSSQMLLDHFQLFHALGDPMYLEGAESDELGEIEELPGEQGKVADTIEQFGFSKRTANALVKAGVSTLNDLVQKTESDLAAFRNFAKSCR